MNDELPRYCKALYLMGYFFYHTIINVFYLQQPPPHTHKKAYQLPEFYGHVRM